MSDVGNLNVRVGLDSTGFRQGISEINRSMKVVQSEFKAASAEVGRHGSELDKLRGRSDSLTQQTDLQRQKVAQLDAAHKASVEAKGEHAKATQNLEIQLNKAQASLSGMEADLEGINRQIETQSSGWYKLGATLEPLGQSLTNVGDRMTSVGKTLSTRVTAPIAGLGAAIIKVGSDFEAGMSQVEAISGAAGEELEALSDKAQEMGSTTRFSATESAEALQYMAMAGWETHQMLEGIDGVMALAAASGESLASVSDIVTDSMTAFGMEAAQAGDFADLLANTAMNANTNVAAMGETFKYAAPLFGALGYSAEDAALAIGLMADAGIKGSQAGTTLRGALTQLANPTEGAAAAMEDMGISLTDAHGEMLPFEEVLGQLRAGFSNLSEEQQAQTASTMFGRQAMSGMLAIINAADEDFNSLTEATRNYAGASEEAANIMSDNLQGQLRELRSNLEGVAIQIYEIIVPTLRDMVERLQGVVQWFSNLSPATQEALVKFAALAAVIGPMAVVLGTILSTVGNMITTFGNVSKAIAAKTTAVKGMTVASKGAVIATKALAAAKTGLIAVMGLLLTPIGLVVAAIGVLAAAGYSLYKNWDNLKETAQELWATISGLWERLRDSVVGITQDLIRQVSEGWQIFKDTTTLPLEEIAEFFVGLWNSLQSVVQTSLETIQELAAAGWDRLREVTAAPLEAVVSFVVGMWESIQERFREALESVQGLLQSGWERLSEIVARPIEAVVDRVQAMWSRIREFFTSGPAMVQELLRDGWSQLVDITTQPLQAVLDFVMGMWESLREFTMSGLDAIQEAVRSGWERVVDITTTPLQRVIDFISGLWESVRDVTVGTWERIWESLQRTVDNIVGLFTGWVDGLQDLFNRAVDFVLAPFRRIKEGLENFTGPIREALSVLNPFQRHSPSLADNVQAGCAEISRAYEQVAHEASDSMREVAQAKTEFEDAWSERVFRATATRLDILEREKQEALAKARELGASIVDVVAFFERERTAILEQEQARRSQFEANWNDRLFRLTADRSEILHSEYEAALASAEALGSDTADLRAYYEHRITEAKQQEVERRRRLAAEEQQGLDERLRFEEQWNERLFQQTATRLEQVESEYADTLRVAHDLGADTSDVRRYFEQQITDLHEEEARKRVQIAREEQEQLAQDRSQFEEGYADRLFQQTATRLETLQREYDEAMQLAHELGADTTDAKLYYETRITAIQEEEAQKRLEGRAQEAQQATEALHTGEDAREQLAQRRMQFEDQWNERLFQQTATRLDILKREYEEALATAEELGASTADVRRFFEREITKEKEAETERRMQILRQEQQQVEEVRQFEQEWNDRLFQLTASRADMLRQEYADALEQARNLGADTAAIREYFETRITQLHQEESNKRIQQSQREAAAIKRATAAAVQGREFRTAQSAAELNRIFRNAVSWSIPSHFQGTSHFPGGMTMVGELGPELVQLPKGSQIHNDRDTAQKLAAAAGSEGAVTLHIDNFINNTEQDIEHLAKRLEYHRRRISMGRGRA